MNAEDKSQPSPIKHQDGKEDEIAEDKMEVSQDNVPDEPVQRQESKVEQPAAQQQPSELRKSPTKMSDKQSVAVSEPIAVPE
jgi:hypothetical protein